MKIFDSIKSISLLGVVEALKVITAEKSRRIAKFAFDYATKHGRTKVGNLFVISKQKIRLFLFIKVELLGTLLPTDFLSARYTKWKLMGLIKMFLRNEIIKPRSLK